MKQTLIYNFFSPEIFFDSGKKLHRAIDVFENRKRLKSICLYLKLLINSVHQKRTLRPITIIIIVKSIFFPSKG